MSRRAGTRGRSGSSMVEFSIVSVMTVIMLLFVVELGRMMLVYATLANAARAGIRYAVVHGSSRAAGAGSSNASGPGSNPAQVVSVVKDFAASAPLTLSLLVITVTYPNSSNAPGEPVNIIVTYIYNPFVTYFPATVNLGSAARGIIIF